MMDWMIEVPLYFDVVIYRYASLVKIRNGENPISTGILSDRRKPHEAENIPALIKPVDWSVCVLNGLMYVCLL